MKNSIIFMGALLFTGALLILVIPIISAIFVSTQEDYNINNIESQTAPSVVTLADPTVTVTVEPAKLVRGHSITIKATVKDGQGQPVGSTFVDFFILNSNNVRMDSVEDVKTNMYGIAEWSTDTRTDGVAWDAGTYKITASADYGTQVYHGGGSFLLLEPVKRCKPGWFNNWCKLSPEH